MSLSASQTGKAAELLLAAHCILTSKGKLNVSLPLVDEEGADLIVNLKGKPNIILLQIKSRATLTGRGYYRTQVRRQALRERDDLYLLFVYVDPTTASFIKQMWLVPSKKFAELSKRPNSSSPIRVFQSGFTSQRDIWHSYRFEPKELAKQLEDKLSAMSNQLERPV